MVSPIRNAKEIPHADCVDLSRIEAIFSESGLHRSILRLPLLNRNSTCTLCVIGQNPSAANAQVADKTINYLENFTFQNLPEYGAILMLNLYSRVDTNKVETRDLLDAQSELILRESLASHKDFLVVFGKLRDSGAYKFINRVREIKDMLSFKNVYKFALNTVYAPHPGNPKILYSNYDVKIDRYSFSDVNQS